MNSQSPLRSQALEQASPSDSIESAVSMIRKLASMMPPSQLPPVHPELKEQWLLWASGRLALQFRDLGMACVGNPNSDDQCGFIADEPSALTPVCAWHAWLVALAQRGAVEIRQYELLESVRGAAQTGVTEINTVALLAGCTDPKGTGRRLAKALRAISRRLVQLCKEKGCRAQFVFSSPVQAKSPITHQSGVPFTACRIRAEGMTASELVKVLETAIRDGADTTKGEVLVLSNLSMDPA